ncbi:MAG: molecular chaperone DnaJ [Phycisphaerae bacterium]|mgnify:CR=1 FL=1|nr:molecular chaperone DnaJ [Phycisphaerae bacterium]
MSDEFDYYEVLGVDRNASVDDIKRAYRKRAMQYHPDRNPGNAEAEKRFKQCAEAYEVLGDAEKKSRYDQYGRAGLRGSPMHDFSHADAGDIFDMFRDVFGMGDLFGFGEGQHSRGPARGQSLRAMVQIRLREVATGATRTLEVKRLELCSTCGGSGAKAGTKPVQCKMCGGQGKVQRGGGFFRMITECPQCGGRGTVIADPCPDCRGHGRRPQRKTIEVSIPPGIHSGQQIRLSGQGDAGEPGGPRGDLFVVIDVADDPMFERDGNNLFCRVPIGFAQAALGGDVEVPTLTGPYTLTLSAGTQSGEVIRLSGKGLPDLHGHRSGDILVQVIVEVPRKLTSRQKELLREYAESEGKSVLPERKGFLERLAKYFANGGKQ